MYYLTLLFIIMLSPLELMANQFIPERSCSLYSVESEKHEKIGKMDEKKEYKFKNYIKVDNREYAVINDNEKDYMVHKNCGYQKFDDRHRFEKIFSDSEVGELGKISEFDKEILKYCGYFGSHPRKDDLRHILLDEKYRGEFDKIYVTLKKQVRTKTEDRNIFLSELLDVLFKTNGFNHSVCGIMKEKKISGPHYYYRFLDLQNLGVIGKNRVKKCVDIKKIESRFVDAISIDFIDKNGEVGTKCVNSFAKNFDAVKLISLAGLVGKIEMSNNEIKKIDGNIDMKNHDIKEASHNKSCIYKDEANGDVMFKMVYNIDKKSLVTLYPIISDKCLEKNKDYEEKCYCVFVK